MAKKYDRRRRVLKEPQARREDPYAASRSTLTVARKVQPQSFDAGGDRAGRGVVVAICCLLVLGSVTVFVQTARHGFVNCDDDEYVEKNVNIQRGLTPASTRWALTAFHSANWHPLTWMSHTIDWQAFGKWDASLQRYVDSWPGGHHLVNVLLHASCAVLLFLILQADDRRYLAQRSRGGALCHPSAPGRVGGLGYGTQGHAQCLVLSA